MPDSATRPAVLLVDRHDDTRELYAQYLSLVGFQTTSTNNAETALIMARDSDVVVTGISICGGFNGLELVRRIRSHDPHKPLIVLTAYAKEMYLPAAEQAGCSAFLSKPCPPDVLIQEIRRTLESARAARAEAMDVQKEGLNRQERSSDLLKKASAFLYQIKRLT
jgi:DNA-binding NtrC family response regulator